MNQSHVLVGDGIAVLLQEPFYFVSNVQCVVGNRERRVPKAGPLENSLALGLYELRVELGQKRSISPGRESRFLIKEGENTELPLDNVDTRLVVREFDEGPTNLFTNVFLLLKFEYMGVELNFRETR